MLWKLNKKGANKKRPSLNGNHFVPFHPDYTYENTSSHSIYNQPYLDLHGSMHPMGSRCTPQFDRDVGGTTLVSTTLCGRQKLSWTVPSRKKSVCWLLQCLFLVNSTKTRGRFLLKKKAGRNFEDFEVKLLNLCFLLENLLGTNLEISYRY